MLKDQVRRYIKKNCSLPSLNSAKPLTWLALFTKTVGNTGKHKATADRLAALEEAARRGVKPTGDLSRITGFIESDDEAVTTSSLRLVGLWQLSELNRSLVSMAEARKNIRKARV